MNEEQWRFMESQVLVLSIMAAFQRPRPLPIYSRAATAESRRNVQEAVKRELRRFDTQYVQRPSEEQHLGNIEQLASVISRDHTAALTNGTFRIGIAQKALNLYLKYLWCLGRIEEPLHCPVDAITLRGIREVADIRWTQITTIEDYMRCITAFRNHANSQSLACWELRRWNEAQPGAPADAPRAARSARR
jgi:hypothetical protein